ncbi:MAG: AI-2E family transporter [Pseudomonadales bacterium]|jgi:predicted PurR-regulated permease PerM|nr:AI-2E family transporter [Pseudomonadales bacterium]
MLLTKQILVVVTTAVLLLTLFVSIFFLRGVVLALFISFILAAATHTPIKVIHKKTKLPMISCGVIIYFLCLVVFALLLILVLPTLTSELHTLSTQFNLYRHASNYQNIFFQLETFDQWLYQINTLRELISSLLTYAFNAVLYVIAILLISFYLTVGWEKNVNFVSSIVKKKSASNKMRKCMHALELQLGNWIRVRIILFFWVSLLTFIMLFIFDVPYALSLALFAGILNVIVFIGPLIAAIPGILLALTYNGANSALLVAIFYIIIQNIENLFIAPKMLYKSANVSPISGLLGIMIGYALLGITGAFLAIPIIVIAQTILDLIEEWKTKDAALALK